MWMRCEMRFRLVCYAIPIMVSLVGVRDEVEK